MTAALSSQIAPALVPTVVLGGESSLVVDKIAPHLREHGLAVIAHCDWYKARSLVMPEVTRVLFMLTDMVGHHLSVPMVDEARSRGIKVIYGCRKYAVYASRLAAAGFPALLPASLPASPTITVTLATLNPLPQEEAPMATTKPTLLDNTSAMAERVVALLASEPSLSMRVVSERLHHSRVATDPATRRARDLLGIVCRSKEVFVHKGTYIAACEARGITPIDLPPDGLVARPEGSLPGIRSRETVLERVITYLAKNPLARGRTVANAVGEPSATVPAQIGPARSVLGITSGSLGVTVDLATWKRACKKHGLTDVFPVPKDGFIPREDAPVLDARPAPKPRPLREYPLARPPVATPVPVPVPVVASEVAGGDPLKDVRDLVELLRSEMVKHRIESLTLTATDTKVRRLVVVDESL